MSTMGWIVPRNGLVSRSLTPLFTIVLIQWDYGRLPRVERGREKPKRIGKPVLFFDKI